MVTGVELAGPQEVCFDFRHATTAIHRRIPQSERAGRRRKSVTKFYARLTGMGTFKDAIHKVFGQSPERRSAASKVQKASIKAISKLLHRPPTLASAMKALDAARKRPSIREGASDAVVKAATKAIWSLHLALK